MLSWLPQYGVAMHVVMVTSVWCCYAGCHGYLSMVLLCRLSWLPQYGVAMHVIMVTSVWCCYAGCHGYLSMVLLCRLSWLPQYGVAMQVVMETGEDADYDLIQVVHNLTLQTLH